MDDTKKTFFYLIGFFFIIVILFLLISQFSQYGFGFITGRIGDTSYDQVPEDILESDKDYQAIIKTNFGEIKIDLFEKNAPNTVNNFVFLADDNYYDKVKFFRIEKDFVIQGGSRLTLDDNLQNDSQGGPGYKFDDEINWKSIDLSEEKQKALKDEGYSSNPDVKSKKLEKYSIAMANAGPNTNGSQFFIVTGASDSENIQNLQGKHTVFGKVIEGKDVVDEINNVDILDAQSSTPRPAQDIIIEDVEIIAK